MNAALPFCGMSIRVGLYGSSVAVVAPTSARRLAGREYRFRRFMPCVVRSCINWEVFEWTPCDLDWW